MKKKLKNKLLFNKTTIANLSSGEQFNVRGGEVTNPDTCNSQWHTYCNTDCGQNTCETCQTDCYPCHTQIGPTCRETFCGCTVYCPL